MKKYFIFLILLSFCSSSENVIKEATDIIPKSQVIWCNNELNKIEKVIDETQNGKDLTQIYSQTQLENLAVSFDYFSATTEVFYGNQGSKRIIILLRAQLNSNLDEFTDKEGALNQIIEAADFCNSWYQAQN